MRSKIMMLVGLMALLAVLGQAAAQTPTADDVNNVAKELFCPLCTGITVDVCETQQCVQMRSLIAQKLAAGETKEQIKAYFVQQYGQTVLGTPARKGLGLTVWILPFLALLLGLVWVVYVLRNWSSKRRNGAASDEETLAELPDKYLQQLEQELRESE
ncbi:MAG: hypothetical protein GXP41_05005 [Chloroflexi bacterium]|nr:hypothetical protein [Chloroflexota bacterium]